MIRPTSSTSHRIRLHSLRRPTPQRTLHSTRPVRNIDAPPPTPKGTAKEKSAHGQWYADVVPGMIPVALLASAVYFGLQIAQSTLAHERYLDAALPRIEELEREVELLQAGRSGKQLVRTNEGTLVVASSPTTTSKSSWKFW